MSRPVDRQARLVTSGGVLVDNTVDASTEPAAFIEPGTHAPVGEAADTLERTRMSLRWKLRRFERKLAGTTDHAERVALIKQRRLLERQLAASFEASHRVLEPYIVEAAASILPSETWERILTAARLRYLEVRAKPKARGASFVPGRAQG